MKTLLLATIYIFLSKGLFGQSTIMGSVRTKRGKPVAGANIYIKNTFEGTGSDASGHFSFRTILTGEKVLLVSFLGYNSHEEPIELKNDTILIPIILTENETYLNEVVITAGTFKAGDEKTSAVLSTLDMATNSQGFGDLYMALNSLPGTSTADDEGGLLVRGGERYETKTFIDGLLVESPYTAKMPSVPVKGRFSPMLFRGTVFSTGGYSAEYGQALSSALILNTIALPKNDETNIALYSSAANFTKIKKWEKTSISSITQYMNMRPYYNLVRSNLKWEKTPESLSETLVFRKKIKNGGILKAMGFSTLERNSIYYPNMNTGIDDLINVRNQNYFFISTYKDQIGESIIQSGISLNRDIKKMKINEDDMNDRNQSVQVKFTIANFPTEKIKVKLGGDIFYKKFDRMYFSEDDETNLKCDFETFNPSVFAETSITATNKLALRLGGRFEYQSLTQKTFFAPRISAAYQTSAVSQVSLAYGEFTQLPEDNSLVYNNNLLSEEASHFIINYQIIKDNRTFRVEAYYKNYQHLVKYDSVYAIDPAAYSNAGNGYARGIDIFFRDKRTIKNGDFWLAYSLMDSERDYRDFKYSQTPGFVSRHNLSLQYKHYFEKIDSYAGTNYNFASGRPYINPNHFNSVFKTKTYNNLSVSFFHFTELFGKFTMLHIQVSNILGFNNIFGYRFAKKPDSSGLFKAYPVLPMSKRLILFGIYISFQERTEF